jgi:5-formyltetrahydrofolate cyclo-ligase
MKEELRRLARERLRNLSSDERLRKGAEISRHVWSLPTIASARTLLVFASLPTEPPTRGLIREAQRRGIATVYPRCLPDTRQLVLHTVADPEELVPGSFGVLEPHPSCPLVSLADIDTALVPGLLWDRRGARLGRGAGYYDRLLGRPDWQGFACGLFFAVQEAPSLPADPWDVALDAVVTEHGVHLVST